MKLKFKTFSCYDKVGVNEENYYNSVVCAGKKGNNINESFVPKIFITDMNHKFECDFEPDILVSELKQISNQKLIKQKQQVYNLLYFVFLKEFKLNNKSITKNEFGKPQISGYEISISHTDNVVAVAVAKEKIGVDIEIIKKDINVEQIKKRIYGNAENSNGSIYDIYKSWGKKESVFKMLGNMDSFVPGKIDVNLYNCNDFIVKINDKEYMLCWSIDGHKDAEIVII